MSYCKKHNITYDKKNCPECKREWDKNYYRNNKEKAAITHKNYVKNNKTKVALYKNQHYLEHKDDKKQYDNIYRETHRKEIRDRTNSWHKSRYKEDICFRLKQIVSYNIRSALFKNNASKNGISCFTKLDYSIQELKEHIEKQFEPWMTWDNHGKYDPKIWNDNDSTTWTWQIDHIIPQSDLLYASMTDDNFKRCWALENLRPLNSKRNMIDGSTRVRHLK